MIKQLLKYPTRTRIAILALLAVLVCFLTYRLTIKNTLREYTKLQTNQSYSNPESSQQKELASLKAEFSKLNNTIGQAKKAYVTNSELLLESETQITNLNCKVNALPKLIEDKSEAFTCGISELVLEGDYKSLVQGLNNIEKSAIGNHLVSSRFQLTENWNKQKNELLLHLIFKQIKNEE